MTTTTPTPALADRVHELKTDPAVFAAVLSGAKTHEIRANDRGFAVGDALRLRETASTGEQMRAGAPLEYTGREITRTVSHVLTGYGLQDGWCILSLAAQPVAPAHVPAQGVDDIVTALYRRFKDWSKRGFGPDDVTWCEVKADVISLIGLADPSPQIAEVAELPPLRPMPKPHMRLSEAEGSDDYPVFLTAHMQSYARDYARDAIAASRRTLGIPAGWVINRVGDVIEVEHDAVGSAHLFRDSRNHHEMTFRHFAESLLDAPASAGQVAPADTKRTGASLPGAMPALIDSWKRHSKLAENAYFKDFIGQLEAVLAAQPTEGAGQAGQVAQSRGGVHYIADEFQPADVKPLAERAAAPAEALDAARYREACAEGGRIHIDWSASKEEIDARLDESIATQQPSAQVKP